MPGNEGIDHEVLDIIVSGLIKGDPGAEGENRYLHQGYDGIMPRHPFACFFDHVLDAVELFARAVHFYAIGQHVYMEVMGKKSVEARQHQHQRDGFEMLNAPAFEEGPDGMAGFREKLSGGKEDAFVEVQEAVLDVVPQEMRVDPVRVGALSAFAAIFTMQCGMAVLAYCRHEWPVILGRRNKYKRIPTTNDYSAITVRTARRYGWHTVPQHRKQSARHLTI